MENRVGFYITFNGTDLVSTVDLVQQFTGAAVGRLSMETIGPEEHYEFWQVSLLIMRTVEKATNGLHVGRHSRAGS